MNLKKWLLFAGSLICAQSLMAQVDGTVLFESKNLSSVEQSGYSCVDTFAAGQLELTLNNIPFAVVNNCKSINFERTQWNAQLVIQDPSITAQQYNITFGTQAACEKNLTNAVANFKQQGLVSFITEQCTVSYQSITKYYVAHFVVLR